MTEREWQTCADPNAMLAYLAGQISDRKLLLFNCAVCWMLSYLLRDKQCFRSLRVLEKYADGVASDQEVRVAHNWARSSVYQCHERWRASYFARCAVHNLTLWPSEQTRHEAHSIAWASQPRRHELGNIQAALDAAATESETAQKKADDIRHSLAPCLRDLLGNPYHPPTMKLTWRTETVVALASAVYDEKAFDRLPILADALEDAGCHDAEILGHCRGPGPHARGCFVIDLLLGKE